MATLGPTDASDVPTSDASSHADYRRRQEAAKADPANMNPARTSQPRNPENRTAARRSVSFASSHPSRQVFGLMSFAVIFALVGHELGSGGTAPAVTQGIPALTSGGRIIVGGFVATALLVGMSEFGDAGAQLGVGLALITSATSILVYGGPVWSGLGKLFGGRTGGTPTSSTTPTAGGASTPSGAGVYAHTAPTSVI